MTVRFIDRGTDACPRYRTDDDCMIVYEPTPDCHAFVLAVDTGDQYGIEFYLPTMQAVTAAANDLAERATSCA